MRPILLKGHERPLTFIKYNKEGDLLVTCAKDHHPTLWYSDDGERVVMRLAPQSRSTFRGWLFELQTGPRVAFFPDRLEISGHTGASVVARRVE